MKTWIVAGEVLLMGFVFMHAATRLWPKTAGYHYLRYDLSRRGIRIKEIPAECIRDFVGDALEYARTVCAPAAQSGATGRPIAYFEFERMLRNHSVVVHALLTGRTAVELDAVEMRELIRCEMRRAGVNPATDTAQCQLIESEARTGRSWDRHRAILCRYDLSAPLTASPDTALQ
jgi:hypothetical protein